MRCARQMKGSARRASGCGAEKPRHERLGALRSLRSSLGSAWPPTPRCWSFYTPPAWGTNRRLASFCVPSSIRPCTGCLACPASTQMLCLNSKLRSWSNGRQPCWRSWSVKRRVCCNDHSHAGMPRWSGDRHARSAWQQHAQQACLAHKQHAPRQKPLQQTVRQMTRRSSLKRASTLCWSHMPTTWRLRLSLRLRQQGSLRSKTRMGRPNRINRISRGMGRGTGLQVWQTWRMWRQQSKQPKNAMELRKQWRTCCREADGCNCVRKCASSGRQLTIGVM
mmetsp:Transcript_11353/g.19872  ORF Transcript_11353/g.19872 Transcript_11353/m.19872 type:complete len:279 (-) Transcript_11353:205-1041(-)